MSHISISKALSLTLRSAVNTVRALLIHMELRNTEYQLAHIAENRANDHEVERLLHKRRVELKSNLRRLEAK